MKHLLKSKIQLIKTILATLAVVTLPFASIAALAPLAHADATPSSISVFNDLDNNGFGRVNISINSSGPFTQDFQYVICWRTDNGQGTPCATSPWASDAAKSDYNNDGLGLPSPWTWGGSNNEFGGGSSAYFSSLNTRPLPAGTELVNVRLGIQISEDNSGNLVTDAPNGQQGMDDLSCDNQITGQSYNAVQTPLGGGASNWAYAHIYGCTDDSQTPDVFRIWMSADLYGSSASGSNFPSTMTTGQTITNATVQINNLSTNIRYYNGLATFVPSSNSSVATGTPSGNSCATSDGALLDQNGNPVNNYQPTQPPGPSGPNDTKIYPSNYCNTPVAVTGNGMFLTHSGSFTTPQTVPVTYSGTLDEVYTPDTYISDPCPPSGGDSSAFRMVPTAEAAKLPPQDCGSEEVDGGLYGYVNPAVSVSPGTSYTFTIPTFTAPSTPGTYTETWTFSDSNGAVPGGTYSTTIKVQNGATGTINVTADRATSAGWDVTNCSSCIAQNSKSATYNNVPSGTSYSILDSQLQPLTSDGFKILSNNPLVFQTKPSLLARVIHTVDAASSSCSNNGFTCYLAAGGTASFNLGTTYCSLTVQTQVNGANQALSGLSYTVSGGPNNPSQTITNSPQTIQMIADPTNGSNFTLTDTTDPTSWNGYTLDPATSSTGTSVSCTGGSSGTIIENYVTRAKLQVH